MSEIRRRPQWEAICYPCKPQKWGGLALDCPGTEIDGELWCSGVPPGNNPRSPHAFFYDTLTFTCAEWYRDQQYRGIAALLDFLHRLVDTPTNR